MNSRASGWFFRALCRSVFGVGLACSAFIATVRAQDTWSASTIRPTGSSLYGVVFAGQFVAVGQSGSILVSGDGSSWIPVVSGTSQSLTGAAFGAGLYVVVGGNGAILTSDTGAAWTQRSSGTSNNLYAVIFAGGQFVATGINGTVLTSPNGITWTTRNSGRPSDSLLGIAHNGSGYVVAGSAGTIITSPNGIAWTSQTSGTANWLYGVAFGNGRFVAVGVNGAIVESTNGVAWSSPSSVNWPLNDFIPQVEDLQGIVFGGGRFVIAGFHSILLQGTAGGSAFTTAFVGTNSSAPFSAVAHSGSRFVAVGDFGSSLSSTDGTTWSGTIPLAPSQLNAIASNGSSLVTVGSNSIQSSLAYRSADAATWRASILPASANGVAFGSGVFTAVGTGISTSSDGGASWTPRDSPAVGPALLSAVAFGLGQFMAVGPQGLVFTSANGTVWTRRLPGGSSSSYSFTGVAMSNTQYAVVGSGSNGGVIVTTSNLSGWNFNFAPNALYGVVFAGGQFVAVGASGAVVTSADGTLWTPRTSGTSATLRSVTYAGGRYVAVGAGGIVMVSADGVSWGQRSAGTSTELLGVVVQGSTIVAVGGAEVVALSVVQTVAVPVFTAQPTSLSVAVEQSAQFTAIASGSPTPTYQWQRSTNGGSSWSPIFNGDEFSGTTTTVLTVVAAPVSSNGHRFRNVATNIAAIATSSAAILTVTAAIVPVVAAHPANQAVTSGQNALFSVTVTGSNPLSYQWQRLPFGAQTWENMINGGNFSGVNASVLGVSGVPVTLSGNQFRVLATNSAGQVTSNSATLTVNPAGMPPSITAQPVALSVTAGQAVAFTVSAAGSTPLTYQWQRFAVGGVAWTNLTDAPPYSGTTTSALGVATTTTAMTGDQFRVVVTNSVGVATSNSAPLTVNASFVAPQIVTHPASQTVTAGQSLALGVVASGSTPFVYQWERLAAGAGAWGQLSDGGAYSGTTSSVLSIVGATAAMNGDQFRVRVTNGSGNATSNPAVLTVTVPQLVPTILADPANQSVTLGQSASFVVSAGGTGPLTYQWQRMLPGANAWFDVSNGSGYSGATSTSLTVLSTTIAMNGDRFRAVVTNSLGTSNSLGALLTIVAPNQAPLITLQPVFFAGSVGQSAVFTIGVSGNPVPSIQWEFSADNGSSWQMVPIGGSGTVLTLSPLSLNQNGFRYRAIATNGVGTATSNPASLTVAEIGPTVITAQPVGGSYRAGQAIVLSVSATGTPPFQFQWYKNGLPIPGAIGASFAIPSATAGSAGAYYVEVTGVGGKVTSRAASIAMLILPQFAVQPVDALAEVGLSGAFSAVAIGSPNPTIQWFGRIGGGDWLPLTSEAVVQSNVASVVVIDAVTAARDGQQVRARASNDVGSVDSAIATLRVTSPTTAIRIIDQPDTFTVRAGQPAAFEVVVEGPGPFTFQWRKDGVTLPGKTLSICALNSATSADTGGYSVIVRNASGASATSNSAFLTVAGAVETTFDPLGGPNGEVEVMISLVDGGLLSAGSFTRVAGIPRARLVKFKRDGSVDLTFDPGTGPNGVVQALVELADGKFLAVGQFDFYDGAAVPGVVRIDAQGKRDPGFSPVLPVTADGFPFLPTERYQFAAISLRGGGYLLGGRAGTVALTVSGAAIPQSQYDAQGGVFALLQQFDGGIVVGGDFTVFGGLPRTRIVRLQPNFQIDPIFNAGTGPNAVVNTLLRVPDGSMYVMGRFTSYSGQPRPSGIARILSSGALDLSYNPALLPLALASGDFSAVSNGIRPAANRLDTIRAGVVQPNGGLVVSNGQGATQTVVAIEPSGVVSTEVIVPVQGAANALATTSDEEVAVAGDFTGLAGAARNSVGVVSDASEGSRLINLSCRARIVGSGNPLIFGFVVEGPESMRVLIRGAGPSLRNYGIADALERPRLTVFNSAGEQIAVNSGWRTVPDPIGLEQIMAQVGAFPYLFTDDTALSLNLAPGAYTAHLNSNNGGQGVALGEIYAVDRGRTRLINSSVRGTAGTGGDVLIPGFVIQGGSRLLLLRASGPALTQFGVPNVLARPSMELRKLDALLTTNQGWGDSPEFAAVQARTPLVGAFAFAVGSPDSAVLKSLDAGTYTVVVRGADGGTGTALVEVYDANGIDPTVLSQ